MPAPLMTNKIMQIQLGSWRYLALLTLPPLWLAFTWLNKPVRVVLLGLFFVAHYFCWRLWLDEKLFVLLISRHDLEFFDEGMAQLWLVRKGPTRPLEARWQGARKLLHRTMLTVGLLWLITAGFLLIHLLI